MYKKISSKVLLNHSRLLVEEDEVLLDINKKIKAGSIADSDTLSSLQIYGLLND